MWSFSIICHIDKALNGEQGSFAQQEGQDKEQARIVGERALLKVIGTSHMHAQEFYARPCAPCGQTPCTLNPKPAFVRRR